MKTFYITTTALENNYLVSSTRSEGTVATFDTEETNDSVILMLADQTLQSSGLIDDTRSVTYNRFEEEGS